MAEFRYSVYVEEMGRAEPSANHQAKTLRDPLDDEGVNIAAYDHSSGSQEIVGCVRLNYSWRQALSFYEDFYEMRRSPSATHPGFTSICTRLMVGKRHRRSDLPVRLVRAAYSRALMDGVRQGYIDCNQHLNDFFLRMGFVMHCNPKTHPIYGTVTVLRLAMHDITHFEACRSPLAADLRDWMALTPTRQPDRNHQ
ncbi:MAG: GNAT family N-acetyltransferase [Planctomycetes bacterium]|nr:GNAT family N-acetyltransferase [Planctomycetota bacterium]